MILFVFALIFALSDVSVLVESIRICIEEISYRNSVEKKRMYLNWSYGLVIMWFVFCLGNLRWLWLRDAREIKDRK